MIMRTRRIKKAQEVVNALSMYEVKLIVSNEYHSCFTVKMKHVESSIMIWVENDLSINYENYDDEVEDDVTDVNSIDELKDALIFTFDLLEEKESEEYDRKQIEEYGHERLEYERYMCDKMHEE